MNRRFMLAVILAAPLSLGGSAVISHSESGASNGATTYICPVTGGILPCPDCCVLK